MSFKRILCVFLTSLMVLSALTLNTFAAEKSTDEQEKAHITYQGGSYEACVGDTVIYTVELYAQELFENIQATLYFDYEGLEFRDVSSYYPSMPNLEGTSCVLNTEYADGVIKFNASLIRGIDFREEKVLLNLGFKVKEAGSWDIRLQMEFMTVLGNTGNYFFKNEPQITEGIGFDYSITPADLENPPTPQAQICVDDVTYRANVGDVLVYTVKLSARELFENIQGSVYFDSDVLEITDISEIFPVMPNLQDSNPVFNPVYEDGVSRFNASNIQGIDFSQEQILLNLGFCVKKAGYSKIETKFEFMTILGGEDHYFFKGEAVQTKGINIAELLAPYHIPEILGDADGNGKLNVKDATTLQKYIASITTLTEEALSLADVNGDGKVNVRDATTIQKVLAGLIPADKVGQIVG